MSLITFISPLLSISIDDAVRGFLILHGGAASGTLNDMWGQFFKQWATSNNKSISPSGSNNDQTKQFLLAYLGETDVGQSIDDMWARVGPYQKTGLGPELVVNGDFSLLDLSWLLGSGWTVVLGLSLHALGLQGDLTSPSAVAQAGERYRISYTLSITAGQFTARMGNTAGVTRTASGNYVEDIIATDTTAFAVRASALAIGSATNISVRQYI